MKTIISKIKEREAKIGYLLIVSVAVVSYALTTCFNCL